MFRKKGIPHTARDFSLSLSLSAQRKSRAKPLRDVALKLFVLAVGATAQGYLFQAPFPRQALPAAALGLAVYGVAPPLNLVLRS